MKAVSKSRKLFMARSLLRSGVEVNKINHIRGFGERQVGAFVILFDLIFQGLAISLMAEEIASPLLSRITVPILYYLSERRKHASDPKPGINPNKTPDSTFRRNALNN
jgi:hypothetical protein